MDQGAGMNIVALKQANPYQFCNQYGHWKRECPWNPNRVVFDNQMGGQMQSSQNHIQGQNNQMLMGNNQVQRFQNQNMPQVKVMPQNQMMPQAPIQRGANGQRFNIQQNQRPQPNLSCSIGTVQQIPLLEVFGELDINDLL